MTDIRIDVLRLIDADSTTLYQWLADFEHHVHPLLPPSFSEYRVEAGGFGEGTVISFAFTTYCGTQRLRLRISEPILGKVITGFDQRTLLMVTFRLRREGTQTQVEIDTSWPIKSGLRGLKRRLCAQVLVRRELNQILDRLEKQVLNLPPAEPSDHPLPGRRP